MTASMAAPGMSPLLLGMATASSWVAAASLAGAAGRGGAAVSRGVGPDCSCKAGCSCIASCSALGCSSSTALQGGSGVAAPSCVAARGGWLAGGSVGLHPCSAAICSWLHISMQPGGSSSACGRLISATPCCFAATGVAAPSLPSPPKHPCCGASNAAAASLTAPLLAQSGSPAELLSEAADDAPYRDSGEPNDFTGVPASIR